MTFTHSAIAIASQLHFPFPLHDTFITYAYIGPGAGFAFLGSLVALVASLFAAALSLVVWPFRLVLTTIRRRRRKRPASVTKVIFLGLDGFDPKLTERWMAEGKLPNLQRLRETGYYSALRTTSPPLSPVAWSTFATGVNPAKHNIFDFINRDLGTYAPELSSARVRPAAKSLVWGKWKIPLSRPTVELRRKSEPFWKILSRYAVESTILRIPISFPPEKFEGRMLSAMCTPDLLGTQGSFSWFTNDPQHAACDGGLRIPLTAEGGTLHGSLPGPEQTSLPFRLSIASPGEYLLQIDKRTWSLRLGEYTPWIRVRFRLTPFSSAHGIVRFLLTGTEPVSLYATPVEIDPQRPALPISHPGHYSLYLAKLLGSYATLGLAEDTWALNEGAIDESAFLQQARLIQAEREAMYFSALDHARSGVVACVFDTTDRVQHMFYRYLDPRRSQSNPSIHSTVIEDLYRDMDRIVGRTLEYSNPGTAVFVLSDHGFCSFRRGVNLNTWLHQNGYLVLTDATTESGDYLDGVDWTRTRAYAFGLSGLYLNLAGREARGIVQPSDAATLKFDIISKLNGLRDPDTGETAILNVYDTAVIYSGPYLNAAPDILPGYADGYRASWSTATGRVPPSVFEDNNKPWSGDHCVDPSLVPGVLFANQKLESIDPGIEDLAPTVLSLFGIDKPGWMEGKSLVNAT